MGGAEFQERYDTPYYCSPSSETYWSAWVLWKYNKNNLEKDLTFR
jgi:hypothetical protein